MSMICLLSLFVLMVVTVIKHGPRNGGANGNKGAKSNKIVGSRGRDNGFEGGRGNEMGSEGGGETKWVVAAEKMQIQS